MTSMQPKVQTVPSSSDGHSFLFIAGGAVAVTLLVSKTARGWLRNGMQELVNLIVKPEDITRSRRLDIWRQERMRRPNTSQNKALLDATNGALIPASYNQEFERALFQLGLNVGQIPLQERELVWCYSYSQKCWTMKTALLVGGKAVAVIVSPAAARSLGFLDPATDTVLPAYRSNSFLEKLLFVSNDHKTIVNFHFSIAGREEKLMAVVEEMPGTVLPGKEYIVLPWILVHGLGAENNVDS